VLSFRSHPGSAGSGPLRDLAKSLDSLGSEDDNRRAVGHEGAVGASLKNLPEFASVETAGVPFKSCGSSRPHQPRDMRDIIFDAMTALLSRIAPVVFSDELLQTPRLGMLWSAYGSSRQPAPLVVNPPLIFSCFSKLLCLNVVPHWKACVILFVYNAGCRRNRVFRHNLGDENNPSSITAALVPTNIETQVDLIEISVKRNGKTPK